MSKAHGYILHLVRCCLKHARTFQIGGKVNMGGSATVTDSNALNASTKVLLFALNLNIESLHLLRTC
jgi:hypothetical protein